MRIAFLSDDFPPQSFGGAGISTYDLALGVKNAGHEVFVITTTRNKSEEGESDYNGLKIFKIANDYNERWRAYISLYNPMVVREVDKLIKRIKPDVVHANNIHFYLSYHSLKIAKKYARAVVITLRDAMSFSYGKLRTAKYLKNLDAEMTWFDQLKQAKKRWNPLRNFFIKKYLRHVDKRLAVSSALKEALAQNGIKDVEVMHSGADVTGWQVSPEQISAFKSKHGLQDKKVIFFGGRLSEAKGVGLMSEAMKLITKEISEATLFTPGTTEGWLDREEMKYALASSDVVVVPSVCFDAFPRLVLEAGAVGKPVISTPYGGAKEIIAEGITGYIINPSDIKDFADKVIDLLKNPEKAKSFGRAGKGRVEKDFALKDKVVTLLGIYESLLKRNGSKE